MDINRIHQLLQNPDTATESDLVSLESLAQKYAWSSFIKILIARISQHFDHADQGLRLNTAAIYASDRGNLKKYITNSDYLLLDPADRGISLRLGSEIVEADSGLSVQQADEGAIAASPAGSENVMPHKPSEPESDAGDSKTGAVIAEVLQNIANLRSRIQNFNLRWNKDAESAQQNVYRPPEEQANPLSERSNATEELIDLPALETTDINPKGIPPAKPENADLQTEQHPQADSEHRISHRNYQDQLIERFIQRSSESDFTPVPPAVPHQDSNPEDLSQSSTRLSDNAISENLAHILFRQGKTEMAVDIYRKLIWKFPQKKAYFADQIDKMLSSK